MHNHCFRKSPQLRTWSACGPNWWNGPHLGRISHKRSHFPNHERKVAVNLWKREREVSIRLRTRVRACISWEMGLYNTPSMINNITLLSQNVLFKDFIAFWWKLRLEVRKSSKLGPHLGRILLKRSLFSHCEAFDFQVRIARFRLRKHWPCGNRKIN